MLLTLALLLACKEPGDVDTIRVGVACVDDMPHIRWETDLPGRVRVTYISLDDRTSKSYEKDYTCVQAVFPEMDCDSVDEGLFFVGLVPVTSEVMPDCQPGYTGLPWNPDATGTYR